MAASQISHNKNSVCPFCGLLCDDIDIVSLDGKLNADLVPCPIAKTRYQESLNLSEKSAEIGGKRVSYQVATRRAAQLIRNAKSPLIAGLHTDVAGARSALALADRIGAVIVKENSRSHRLVSSRLQTYGGYLTTLTEVNNRADLIILIGNKLLSQFPRLLERTELKSNNEFRFISNRKFAWIGNCSSTCLAHFNEQPLQIRCELNQVGQILSLLRANFEDRRNSVLTPESFPGKSMKRLVTLIGSAQYSVLLWSTEEFNFSLGDLAVDSIFRLIDSINLERRCAGMPLSLSAATTTVNQVATWQCGKPLPLNFRSGSPEVHMTEYAYDSKQNPEDADLVIWVGGLEKSVPKFETSAKLIYISTVNPGSSNVFIPVGVPGIHHNTHLFRTDSVVSLFQKTLTQKMKTSSAKVIDDILSELGS